MYHIIIWLIVDVYLLMETFLNRDGQLYMYIKTIYKGPGWFNGLGSWIT